ncbi:hypothetical protein PENANT_c021G07426 [Penicillium antarcticum]|uniref:Retrotransposon gag domain-containing protein n=1 Tax=Penicillium antarcticum TaxID=416450 RepID=A0A1V6Q0G3_9EURO|nr:uncharacterized protein N7508_010960 [Penicillium antarcticum]KAJ5296139.1 hypothetical protein N7508_010960 [Penicillium antarcticum]OQD82547.1 hypothetical protein PENANT_c021G07426 [Penicillium antarcticum]
MMSTHSKDIPDSTGLPIRQPGLAQDVNDQEDHVDEALARRQELLNQLSEAREKQRKLQEKLALLSSNNQQELSHKNNSPPPPSEKIPTFWGRTASELNAFLGHLNTHFDEYPDWFAYSPSKVTCAVKCLSEKRHEQWKSHVQDLETIPPWSDFLKFCLRVIHEDPENIDRDFKASAVYEKMRQKHTQSVRDLVAELEDQHQQLLVPYDNTQRKDRLRSAVLVAILIEADTHSDEPEDYASYVEFLHNAEMNIPVRQQALREAEEASS